MCTDMPERSFIHIMGKMMNTGDEITAETYAACSRESTLQVESILCNLVLDVKFGSKDNVEYQVVFEL